MKVAFVQPVNAPFLYANTEVREAGKNVTSLTVKEVLEFPQQEKKENDSPVFLKKGPVVLSNFKLNQLLLEQDALLQSISRQKGLFCNGFHYTAQINPKGEVTHQKFECAPPVQNYIPLRY